MRSRWFLGILLVTLLLPVVVSADDYYTSQYPPVQNTTYVKSTTDAGTGYYPYLTTDPTKSLTGGGYGNEWLSSQYNNTNQRFHIDLGSAKNITRIYYENAHSSGASTGGNAKTFTFWGSNTSDSFQNLTYSNNTGWIQLTTNTTTLSQHVAADVEDPHYILVMTPETYRYYAFKFADTYNPAIEYMDIRRIELQSSVTSWSYATPGTYYWTCPDGVHNITVKLDGAGGSGRGSWVCSAPDTCAGDGGKAGDYATISRIAVVPGTVYPIVVGAKGANATHDTASNAGGATTAFGVSMSGGAGGGYLYTVANGGNGENGDGSTTYAFDGGAANPLTGGTAGAGRGAGGGGGAGYTGGGLDTQGGAGGDGYVEIWAYGLVSNNIPQFSADITSGAAGTLVHFTDLSTITNATGLVYNWSFGDGTYSSVMGSVQHVYSYTGSYDVKLTLTSAAGEISELKPAYISITSQDITIYPVPRTVTLTCVDENLDPVSNVYVTVTPLNFTAPVTWITTFYGFSGVDFSGTTLMGYTGTDGSWSGPIMSSYLYNFSFTKSGMTDYSMTFYPSSTSYIIRLPLTVAETPINELVSYTLYNATVNSTAEMFNLTYRDTSGGTSSVSLIVKNDTGAIMYNNTTASPGTATIAMSSGALTHEAGETYEYQLSAVQSKVGYVNQSYFVTWERLRTLSMFPAWVSQWFGIILVILMAGIFSAISVKFAVVILPFWTGFLCVYMRMIDPMVSVGSFLTSLGIIAVIGAVKYTRTQESKL